MDATATAAVLLALGSADATLRTLVPPLWICPPVGAARRYFRLWSWTAKPLHYTTHVHMYNIHTCLSSHPSHASHAVTMNVPRVVLLGGQAVRSPVWSPCHASQKARTHTLTRTHTRMQLCRRSGKGQQRGVGAGESMVAGRNGTAVVVWWCV